MQIRRIYVPTYNENFLDCGSRLLNPIVQVFREVEAKLTPELAEFINTRIDYQILCQQEL